MAIFARARLLLDFVLRRWKIFAAALAAFALLAAAGALAVAWLGLYNVAASEGHWYVVDRFLRFGMENSVEAREPDLVPPDLGNPDLVRLGAGHYYAGCAYCHGAPGQPITPVSQHMLPAPPDLAEHVHVWTDQELFWLVKHGLKYTGMPAWPVQDRDDEIWALVAFMRALPGLDEATYRDLALGRVELEPLGGQEIATGSGESDAVDACARCHGSGRSGPLSALVPRLHGQPVERLLAALRDYQARQRSSGIMQVAVSGLNDRQLQELASYFASLPPLPPARISDRESIARGREIALRGVPEREVPACAGCHSATALPVYPRLAGQNLPYIVSRLSAWRSGQRVRTDTAKIMAPIAQRLTEEQIADVAAYFASGAPETSDPVR